MTKVYIATEGSYSDYRILGVFVTREAAAEVGEVEEYELWDKPPKAVTSYEVHGWPNQGWEPNWEIHVLRPWDYGYETYGHSGRPLVHEWPNGGMRISGGVKSVVEKAWQDQVARRRAVQEGIA